MVPRSLAVALVGAVLLSSAARAQNPPQAAAAPPEVQIKQRQGPAGAPSLDIDMKLFMNGPAAPAESAKQANGSSGKAAAHAKPNQGKADAVFSFKGGAPGMVEGKEAVVYKGLTLMPAARIADASLAKMVGFIGAKDTDLAHYTEGEKNAAKELYSVLATITGSRCALKKASSEEAKALRGAEAALLKRLPDVAERCKSAAGTKIACDAQPPECNR